MVETKLVRIDIDKIFNIPGLILSSNSDEAIISVPTMIGCPVGCIFCVSTSKLAVRVLTASEIAAFTMKLMEDSGKQSFLISFSGEGEIALNRRNVIDALVLISSTFKLKYTGKIRYRIVTSGIKSSFLSHLGYDIDEVTGQKAELRLSLHSVLQETRRFIIPVSDHLDTIHTSLMQAASEYSEVSLNYVLMPMHHNQTTGSANRLADWIGTQKWTVVLSPLLQTRLDTLYLPRSSEVEHFKKVLETRGINVLVPSMHAASIMQQDQYSELTYQGNYK